MCAEEPLFSLTPVSHFLSLHPSSLQSATSCPSLLPSEVPPAPSGMAQDFALSLRNVQEVQQTTLSHIDAAWTRSRVRVVKMIGIKQKHMVCSLQAGLHTDGHLSGAIWVNECAKLEFLGAQSYRRQIGKRSSPFSVAAQLPGPRASDAFQQEAELCDRQHTVQNAARTAGALMLRCWP